MRGNLLKTAFFLVLCALLFAGCAGKEKINISQQEEEIPGLKYSLQIPEYPDYPEFSKAINDALVKDFEKYKRFAVGEWESGAEDTLTYRTIAQDFSNKDYVNVFITKYIFRGINSEDEYYITFCWDKKQKKLVGIEDVTGMTDLELMEYCRNYVKTHLEDVEERARSYVDSCVDLALNEDIRRYSNFVAAKDSVIIHFASGDSAPIGYGPQTVEIKRR